MIIGTSDATIHWLNQYWLTVNLNCRNKLQWNSNKYSKIFIQEKQLKMSSEKSGISIYTHMEIPEKLATILFRSWSVIAIDLISSTDANRLQHSDLGVAVAVRFLVVGTISIEKNDHHRRGQPWVEQYLTYQ